MFSACGESDVIQVSSYDQLVDAMKGDKGVIQLTADIDVKDQVFANRKVTLDLNGKPFRIQVTYGMKKEIFGRLLEQGKAANSQ